MRVVGAVAAMAMCVGLGACLKPVPLDEPKESVPVEDARTDEKDPDTPTEKPAQTDAGTDAPTEKPAQTDEKDPDAQTDARTDEKPKDAQAEKLVGVSINLSDDSILKFDGDAASAQLVEDMRAGKTPTSCTVLYDQMGALPSVTITDARTMREVYKKLARMHVEGKTDMSITDNYHFVSFELQDGAKVSYGFEGEGILARGKQNYAVRDQSGLWTYVRQLQEQQLREESAGDDWLAIELDDEEELVQSCPTSAPAGEVVQVIVPVVLDVDRHVAVNGNEDFGSFVTGDTYEFVMPDKPVTIRVWTDNEFTPGS